MSDKNRKGPRALVTGASRGIGRAVAIALLDAGYEVIGTSRVPADIPDPPSGVRFIALDLADNASIDRCAAEAGAIDVLVNNGGYSLAGPLSETPLPEIERLIAVNWTGVVRLTRALVPHMISGSKIINMGSLSARIPVPFVAVYAGVKGAIEAFTFGLRYELAPLGISVSVVEPAFVKTGIRQDAFIADNSPHTAALKAVRAFRSNAMAQGASPQRVGETVLKILQSENPGVVWVVGKRAHLMNAFRWLLPAKFFERLVRRKMGI